MKTAYLILSIILVGFAPWGSLHARTKPKPSTPAPAAQSAAPARTYHTFPPAAPAQSPTTNTNTAQSPAKRTITITNAMLDALPAYKHWSGTYKPDIFELKVAGKIIKPGEKTTLTLASNEPIEVEYYSKFENGRQTRKRVALEPAQDQKEFKVQFEWHDKYRIKIPGATAKTVTVVK